MRAEMPALKRILDREASVAVNGIILETPIKELEELVNYATNLIGRLGTYREGEPLRIILFTFRHMIELVDAISVMMAGSVIVPARSLLRSEFEGFLTIKYLLQDRESSAFKAKCFYYCYWLGKEKLYNEFRKLAEDNSSTPEIRKKASGFISSHQRPIELLPSLLSDPDYNDVRTAVVKWRCKRKNGVPDWYSLNDGPTNIRDLAEKVDEKALYVTIYGLYSKSIHSVDIDHQILMEDGLEVIRPLRIIDEWKMTYNLASLNLIRTMIKICDYYNPEEGELLLRWMEMQNYYPSA